MKGLDRTARLVGGVEGELLWPALCELLDETPETDVVAGMLEELTKPWPSDDLMMATGRARLGGGGGGGGSIPCAKNCGNFDELFMVGEECPD